MKQAILGVLMLVIVVLVALIVWELRRDNAPAASKSTSSTRGASTDAGSRQRAPTPTRATPTARTSADGGSSLERVEKPQARRGGATIAARLSTSARGRFAGIVKQCGTSLAKTQRGRVFVNATANVGSAHVSFTALKIQISGFTDRRFVQCVRDRGNAQTIPMAAAQAPGSYPVSFSFVLP